MAIGRSLRNKAVYIAPGIRPDGTRDVPDIRIEQTEGANGLRNRGIAGILTAVVDG